MRNTSSTTIIPPTGKLGQSISAFRENAVRNFFQENASLSRRAFERQVGAAGSRMKGLLRDQFGPNFATEAAIYRRTPAGQKWISGASDYAIDPLYTRTVKWMLGAHVAGQFANLGQQHA